MESNINNYKLEQAGKEYFLKISIVNNTLRMSCKSNLNSLVKFSRDFTIEDLKQLDKVFNLIQTPFEALQIIDKALKEQKVNISEEVGNIRIDFFFQSEGKGDKMQIQTTEKTTTINDYTTQYNYQNMETTNNVIDTGIDFNNYNVATGAQDITYNQNIETTQYQEGINTFNEYQTAPVENYQTYESTQNYNEYQSTPVENYQTYESTQNYNEYTTNIQPETYQTTLYTPPDEVPTQNQFIQTEQINEYQTQTTTNEQPQPNKEIEALKAENQLIKQQIQELNALKQQVIEAQYLKNQLNQIEPLREKASESDMIGSQLSEIESLKQKVNELSRTKEQINEINNLKNEFQQIKELKKQINEIHNLKNEFQQINELKNQLNELNNLKNKTIEGNELQERIKYLENIRHQQEKEIKVLRESQAQIKQNTSYGMESKQLYFEEKPEQICVKGDIIHNANELELITRKINRSNKKITLNLLYKATADSDKANAFHNKCDQAHSTIVLIETDKGKRFGGFTSCNWAGECVEKKDEEAFIFSLDKMMTYDNIHGEDAIGCYPKFGPIFMGCQIRIYDNAFTKGGTTFEKGLNFNTEEDYELTGGDREFNVKEIEVYEVVPS